MSRRSATLLLAKASTVRAENNRICFIFSWVGWLTFARARCRAEIDDALATLKHRMSLNNASAYTIFVLHSTATVGELRASPASAEFCETDDIRSANLGQASTRIFRDKQL